MKFRRYRIHVTGHRSQMQVVASLMNNWNKLKLYFGFCFLMERVYYDVDLCINCEINVHGSHSEAETRVRFGRQLQWRHWLWCRVALRFPSNITSTGWDERLICLLPMWKKCLKCLQLVNIIVTNCPHANMQGTVTLEASNKALCESLRNTYQLSAIIYFSNTIKWVKVGLSFFVCIIESLINTVPPASESIYWQGGVGELCPMVQSLTL